MQNIILTENGKETIMNGYLALAGCIWGGKPFGLDFTVEQTIGREKKIKGAFGLLELDVDAEEEVKVRKPYTPKVHQNKSHKKYKEIMLKDIVTNETVQVFGSVAEVAHHLNKSENWIYVAISTKKPVNGYFIATNANDEYTKRMYQKRNVSSFKLVHIETKEEKVLQDVNVVCKFLNTSTTTVYTLSRTNKVHHTGWKVSRI